jgi:lipopolysaccharide transport system ATP-binding protein
LNYQESDFKESIYTGNANSKKPVFFKNIKVCDEKGEVCTNFIYNQAVYIDFEIQINDPQIKCDLFLMVLDDRKRRLFALESNKLNSSMRLKIIPEFLVRGRYSIYTFINQPNIARIDEAHDVCHFEIIDNGSPMLKHGDYDYGKVFGKGDWIYE